jgi:hypothetical protein
MAWIRDATRFTWERGWTFSNDDILVLQARLCSHHQCRLKRLHATRIAKRRFHRQRDSSAYSEGRASLDPEEASKRD